MGERFLLAYAAFAAGVLALSRWVNSNVPTPYMDELIHIPQAQAYCDGLWRVWDARLTTPPGLYLASALVSHSFPLLHSLSTTPALRFINTLILLALPLVYSRLLPLIRHPVLRSSTRGKTTPSRIALEKIEKGDEAYEGLVLGLFPVVAFFGFLYYTDLASILLVLVSERLALKKLWGWSAVAGGFSLLFRQTNIIWVVFIAGTAVVRDLEPPAELHDPPLAMATFLDIPASIASLVFISLQSIPALWPIIRAYLPLGLLSATFVYWNGGIVLGDKTNHIPTLHIPQVYYFVAFSTAFLAPVLLSPKAVRDAVGGLSGSFKRATLSLCTVALMCWTIKNYTLTHAFLLSDNRHYTFYIWRRILNPHWAARYALSPLYLLSSRLIYDRLCASAPLALLPTLLLLLSTALTLVPSPLLEPRYFLTPYLLLRLHLRPRGTRRERRVRLALEAAVNATVLLGTLWVFVRRGWEVDGFEGAGIGRFMW